MRRISTGYTVVELLVALSIILVLAAVGVSAFSSMRNAQAIRIAADEAGYALRAARDASLSSKEGSRYGVRFETDRAIRFTGSSFASSSAANVVYEYPDGIDSVVSLTGGVSQVVFARLTGEASATGTVVFTDLDSGATSSITIGKTGLFDIER